MRAIKRSIADARDEREAREAHDREAREAHEQGARDLRERLDRAARERLDRATRERELNEAIAVDDVATCEHVTRELTTRIDMGSPSWLLSRRPDTGSPRSSASSRTDAASPRSDVVLRTDTASPRSDAVPRTDRAPSLPTDGSSRPIAPVRRADIAPLRCEPCPRVIPARRLFDGTLLQQFQCDGTCVRDQRRASEKARAHAVHHARERTASRHELTGQIVITTVLAVLAVMWIVLAVREANADTATSRRDPRVADGDDDDAIDVAPPPTLEAPFGAPVAAPPIADVLAAAYRAAGLDRDLGRGFVRRSRLAGLVPWLSVRTGRNTSWRDEELDVARGVTIEVRATWRLDRLVFDGRELQVAALDGARRRERRRLAARVIQVYFAWKRAARAVGIQARAATVAEEAAAELDDLTDGWFTEAVRRPDSRSQ